MMTPGDGERWKYSLNGKATLFADVVTPEINLIATALILKHGSMVLKQWVVNST
jgi:hypothetical protein